MGVKQIKHDRGGEKMGYKIREVREAKGMTQAELARISGISRVTISALENGVVRNTTSKTLLKLAEALETTVDHIFLLMLFNQPNDIKGGEMHGQKNTTTRSCNELC